MQFYKYKTSRDDRTRDRSNSLRSAAIFPQKQRCNHIDTLSVFPAETFEAYCYSTAVDRSNVTSLWRVYRYFQTNVASLPLFPEASLWILCRCFQKQCCKVIVTLFLLPEETLQADHHSIAISRRNAASQLLL